MDIQATKIELAQKVLSETRESVLTRIAQLLSINDEIVAYSGSGKPLTLKEYNECLVEAEEDIKAGRVISHEDLKKRVKSWG
ncbi:MAG TPA: hypothetical protein DDX92_01485 [Flavobacteriales bacterium]|jgi:hypothetical protein|nr:hypothetical protein [Flavobacteriales bacterium]